ncbi:hypothetical protein Krac_8569 [Ktedonobacter racemifer DSM 44963]|uniref:Uncharacterized protein n=1 Tax=Ktedonobacter racemifer DSM 44963 TaxID=485913 RepID=D6TN90_KTERA|nr:hypothetical protein Krac_8569 [Ktedonobacter racemifer DSM 44963]
MIRRNNSFWVLGNALIILKLLDPTSYIDGYSPFVHHLGRDGTWQKREKYTT